MKLNIKGLILYALIGFWPVIIFLFVYVQLIMLHVYASGPPAVGTTTTVDASSVLTGVLVVLGLSVPAGLFVSYCFFHSRAGFPGRFLTVYLSWMVFLSGAGFLFLNAVGGVLMAVTDGGTSYLDRLPAYLWQTMKLTAWGHLFIVPWALTVSFLFGSRIGRKFLNPQNRRMS